MLCKKITEFKGQTLLLITLKNPAFVFKMHFKRQINDRSLLTSFPTRHNEDKIQSIRKL